MQICSFLLTFPVLVFYSRLAFQPIPSEQNVLVLINLEAESSTCKESYTHYFYKYKNGILQSNCAVPGKQGRKITFHSWSKERKTKYQTQ